MHYRRLVPFLTIKTIGFTLALIAAPAASDNAQDASAGPAMASNPEGHSEEFDAEMLRPVARVGDEEIIFDDLWVRTREDPMLLRGFMEPEGRAGVLRGIIETMLINKAAIERAELPEDANAASLQKAVFEFESREFAPEEVSDERLQAVYAERRETLGIPASVRVRELFFPIDPGADSATREAARQAAVDALKRLEAGEDFVALARELAHSEMLRALAGDQGYLPLTTYPLLKPAVADLRVGERSGVIELPGGYQIIELLGRRDAIISPFESVSERLRRDLAAESSQRKRRAFLSTYGEKVGVQILDPELQSAWSPSVAPADSKQSLHGTH